MYVTLNAAKAYVYAVAKACDRGETTREDAAGAILYAAERATWMALETIQCLGGNGYINDYPGRAAVARRQALRDRRRHQRNPPHADRPGDFREDKVIYRPPPRHDSGGGGPREALVEGAPASKLAQSSKIFSSNPLATPSPRVRGEGGVRGPLRWAQTTKLRLAERPPHPRFASTSPRAAGRGDKAISFSRRTFAPELCHAIPKQALPSTSQRREAERRQAHPTETASRRDTSSLCHAARRLKRRSRSPLGAPPRHFAEALPSARPGPALPGITGCKRENPLRHQCSEHLAVRTRAGRADAQAARERGHEPRPREPHSLRQSAVTG